MGNLLLKQVQSEDSTRRSPAQQEINENPSSEHLSELSKILCSIQVAPECVRPYPKAQAQKQTSGKVGKSFAYCCRHT